MKSIVRHWFLAVVALFATAAAIGQQKYDGIEYLRQRTVGEKKPSHPVLGSIRFDGDNKALELLDENGVSTVRILYEKITGLQNVTKGVGPTLVHFHDPKHFFRIIYTESDGKPNSVAISADKGDAWEVMLKVQASRGKKIEDKDKCCVWF